MFGWSLPPRKRTTAIIRGRMDKQALVYKKQHNIQSMFLVNFVRRHTRVDKHTPNNEVKIIMQRYDKIGNPFQFASTNVFGSEAQVAPGFHELWIRRAHLRGDRLYLLLGAVALSLGER